MSLEEAIKEAVRRCLDPGVPSLREAIEPVFKKAFEDVQADVVGLRADLTTLRRCLKLEEESTEAMGDENANLRAEIQTLKGPLTCKHEPQFAGGACAVCHAEWIEKAEHLERQVEAMKKLHSDDLRWAMDRNAVLIIALRHEVFGNQPCSKDCEPGGWRKCIGCDERAKSAIGQHNAPQTSERQS